MRRRLEPKGTPLQLDSDLKEFSDSRGQIFPKKSISDIAHHKERSEGSAVQRRRKMEMKHEPPADVSENKGTTPSQHHLAKPSFSPFMMLWIPLAVFRILNGFLVRTSFSPDEYYQSVEIAHDIVFGYGHRTWEWSEQMRGYFHPFIFAILFYILRVLRLDFPVLVVWLPRVFQSCVLAVQDVAVFRIGSVLYGRKVGWTSLLCHLCSWFVYYCGVRTFSNSLETTLTTVALYFWLSRREWAALMVTGCAVVVRPTSGVLWFVVVIVYILDMPHGRFSMPWLRKVFWFCVRSVIAVALWLGVSLGLDRWFYGEWVLVPWKFVYVNVGKNFSSFYGTHPFYWYIVSGIPTMLASFTVLFVIGCYLLWSSRKDVSRLHNNSRLVWIGCIANVVVYSLLAHKEFRFLYPLLPVMMIVCGFALNYFLTGESTVVTVEGEKKNDDVVSEAMTTNVKAPISSKWIKLLLGVIFLSQIVMMAFFGTFHMRGGLSAAEYLRTNVKGGDSVDFLVPCHHAPFHSHVHNPDVSLDFLKCPPSVEDDYIPPDTRFLRDPILGMKARYTDMKSRPTYIVAYDSFLSEPAVKEYMQRTLKYTVVKSFYHTVIPQVAEEFVSTHVIVLKRRW